MEPKKSSDKQIEPPPSVHETAVSTRCLQVFLPAATVYETAILNTKALDLSQPSRTSRGGLRVIQLHDKKQATANARMLACFTANKWGYKDKSNTHRRVNLIGKAACRQVAYDCGFQNPLAYSQLPL